MKRKKIIFVFGTRPEAIKMAPIINIFKKDNSFDVITCSTGQHKEMLDQVIDFFNIHIDYDLALMTENQSISGMSSKILESVSGVLDLEKPDYMFVHGDTTTTAFASFAAFYNKIDLCHIEAGLRTNKKYSPFPEEINRNITSKLSDWHLCPTIESKKNLIKENIDESHICITGNSVIDSLLFGIEKLDTYKNHAIESLKNIIDSEKKIILVTGHRRENFGIGLENICNALIKISKRNDVQIIYPVHLNPNVKSVVNKLLLDKKNIYLIDPLDYPSFIWIMNKSHIILTDSGGIQEEAPSLGVPVLVMRNKTERPEGIAAKTSILVGTNIEKIVTTTTKLLDDQSFYSDIKNKKNPYGDGKASEKILNFFKEKIHE